MLVDRFRNCPTDERTRSSEHNARCHCALWKTHRKCMQALLLCSATTWLRGARGNFLWWGSWSIAPTVIQSHLPSEPWSSVNWDPNPYVSFEVRHNTRHKYLTSWAFSSHLPLREQIAEADCQKNAQPPNHPVGGLMSKTNSNSNIKLANNK